MGFQMEGTAVASMWGLSMHSMACTHQSFWATARLGYSSSVVLGVHCRDHKGGQGHNYRRLELNGVAGAPSSDR